MKNLRVLASLALIATLLTFAVSCIQVQAPAPVGGTVSNESYQKLTGVYSATLGCSLFEADKAVRAAAASMNLKELSRVNENSRLTYEYKDIYDLRVGVTLTLDKNGQAKIGIKFAKTGNQDFSQRFIARVDEQLHALD